MGVSGMTEEPKRQDTDTQESKESNIWDKYWDKIEIFWDKFKKFFLDNPTLVLTLAYLYVAAIGMLYSAVLYGRLGINIFDYSEIADFLLAAFKNPIGILFAGVQVATVVIMAYGMKPMLLWWMGKRSQSDREQEEIDSEVAPVLFIQRVILATAVLVSPGAILLGAGLWAATTARSIENGDKPTVEVRYRSFSGSAGQVTRPGLEFIGATQRAAFFYDADEKRTIVIPQPQIVSIEVPEQD
jgi:hypothetical protein